MSTHGIDLLFPRRALFLCALFGICVPAVGLGQATPRWVVCYSAQVSPETLARYDVVVLDADHHPDLSLLLERGRTALGYLSLTELGQGRASFERLQRAGVVLDRHPVWSESHYLDVRHPEWQRAVIEDLIPSLLEAGFSGVFLDTVDDAEFLESQDPVRFKGYRAAAAQLIRAIRHQYPQMAIMMNRGYAILPDVAGDVDFVLGESVLSTFHHEDGSYARVDSATSAWQVAQLAEARRLNPKLHVFTLDYWDPKDIAGVRSLYREQRANGFTPYVATPALDVVVEEPR